MAKIGLIPMVIHEELKKDYWGTMEKVSQIGYEGIELGVVPDIGGLSALEIKKRYDEIGLEIINVHGVLEDFKTKMTEVIENAHIFGVKYVTLVWTSFESKKWFDDEIPYIIEVAKKLQSEGLQMLYHNHDHEFKNVFDGKRGIDWLYDTVSDDLLKAEVDTAWVHVGKDNPGNYIRQMKDRCRLVHAKDVIMLDDKPQMVELGTGEVDFADVVKAVDEVKCEWMVSEQDTQYKLPGMESITLSYQNLKKLMR